MRLDPRDPPPRAVYPAGDEDRATLCVVQLVGPQEPGKGAPEKPVYKHGFVVSLDILTREISSLRGRGGAAVQRADLLHSRLCAYKVRGRNWLGCRAEG